MDAATLSPRSPRLPLPLPLLLLFLVPLATIVAAEQDREGGDEGSEVVVLTDDNFDALTSEGSWILDFYAPWCGHCRRLEPEFEKAARQMKGKVSFGKIDCTRQSKLKNRFSVRGFPTLKFLRDGAPREYKSGRSAEDLVAFANAVTGKAVQPVKREMADALMDKNGVSFIYIGDKDSEAYETFERVSRRHQGIYFFGGAHGKSGDELRLEFSLPSSGDIVIHLTKGGKPELTSDFDIDKLEAFVQDHKLALLTEINASNFGDISSSGKLVMFAVLNKGDDNSKQLEQRLYDPAAAMKSRFISTKINGERYKGYLKRYEVTASEHTPCLVVVDFDSEVYWSSPKNIQADNEFDVGAWMARVAAGKEPYTPMTPWYNPKRYFRKLSKFMRRFSDTQIMIIMVVTSLAGAGLLFMFFTWLEGPDEVYPRPPPPAPSAPKEEKQGAAKAHPKAE